MLPNLNIVENVGFARRDYTLGDVHVLQVFQGLPQPVPDHVKVRPHAQVFAELKCDRDVMEESLKRVCITSVPS